MPADYLRIGSKTAARESIAVTVRDILGGFGIDIDTETALRERDW